MRVRVSTLSSDLQTLVEKTNGRELLLGDILDMFPQRGHALLIVLLSFPLTLPISIPFIAGPFGLVLAFVGLYLFLGRTPWLPRALREKPVSHRLIEHSATRLLGLFRLIEHLLRPRFPALSTGGVAVRCHAVYVSMLALLLALPVPLPVPFSNTVVAIPIFLCGLGLLEEDGVIVVLGYLAVIPCVVYYGAVVWLGQEGVTRLLAYLHLVASN
ncbi:MAG: exopolysaccharide biosynthesis protein [Candidatus Hydrogenedentes bacterium]|nr:exopolysaccharide biosynthesis protein [Candidatus Hydrogenedentota bacterium]